MTRHRKVFLVADYFIKKNEEDKKGLGHRKLQKLLYYAQAWNLVLNQRQLFEDDFQAWVHGPAIPKVWEAFRDFDFTVQHPEFLRRNFKTLSSKEKEVLDSVWEVYGKYDADYLEILTHNELPWQKARRDLSADQSSQSIISTESMRRFYGQKLQEEQPATRKN